MTLPTCLTHRCETLAVESGSRYVEAVLSARSTAKIMIVNGSIIPLRRKVWLERTLLDYIIAGCCTRAVILREADEVPQ